MSALVRNPEALPQLMAKYPNGLFIVGDIKRKADCKNWVEKTLQKWGSIDHLINNAAITGPCGKLKDLSFEEIEETLQINFLSPLYLIQQLIPIFLKQQSGTVINLSGGGATAPRPHFGAYGASKCALVRFTESLALEYPGLNFFSVAPGALKTPMMEGISKTPAEKIGKEQQEAIHRMKYGGDDPLKAAELIEWLCKNKPKELSGKLISAKWDHYKLPLRESSKVPYWTLRRVDEALIKILKENQDI
ncbi:MAG: SDR family oxidoreductase [Deltaproteobacteria bacterium]|nr:SDR family oxidoreductase [Deltaproteobacteria bacterium]